MIRVCHSTLPLILLTKGALITPLCAVTVTKICIVMVTCPRVFSLTACYLFLSSKLFPLSSFNLLHFAS